MTVPNNSEIRGTLQEFSFSDLLAETFQAGLSGSFRLTHHDEKAMVYLQNGEVIFAVSNLRQHRLFNILLETKSISKEILADIPNFTNDFELAENLVSKGFFDKATIDVLFSKQIEEIIKSILQWEIGNWSFSHLARAKNNLRFQIDTDRILIQYARNNSDSVISQKFRSLEERFVMRASFSTNLNLLPDEAYIFSRFDSHPVKLEDIKKHTGLPISQTLKILYTLWVSRLLTRQNWQAAFSESKVSELLSAKLTLKAPIIKPAVKIELSKLADDENLELELANDTPEDVERKLLYEYLDRVELAESYYEILQISVKAELPEIKNAYFNLAKSYHPDKFHHESDTNLQQRVQTAFTEIARAYETLKDHKSRELYDFKLRKYLESIKEQEKLATPDTPQQKIEPDKAKIEFDQGFDFIMNQRYEEAIPFMARAVQLSPDNARYHAYHGKSLSYNQNHRHKAESEIRVAMKLDPQNPSYWIMLVEFYIQFNLLKRADGELQRLLTAFPGNKEAQVLLDSLAK